MTIRAAPERTRRTNSENLAFTSKSGAKRSDPKTDMVMIIVQIMVIRKPRARAILAALDLELLEEAAWTAMPDAKPARVARAVAEVRGAYLGDDELPAAPRSLLAKLC